MSRQYFRGFVWPRDPKNGVHRYVVIGMLVSEEPLQKFEGKNEIVLNGDAHGIGDLLEFVREGSVPYRVGDASSALMSLEDIQEKEE